ncbi:MAG: Flp pilus assembly protein CpaB [Blastopirellula sp.]|nr:MAG: Flp pilus assembly protein CpaB [Blastopirellula sp.]
MSKISPGTLLLGIIAVMFGLLGAYVVRQNMLDETVAADPAPPAEPVKFTIPMANTDLPAGREITFGDLSVVSMTQEQMVAAGISGQYMADTKQIIGRVLRDDLASGSRFMPALMYAEGDGPSIMDKLEPGMRAVTVAVAMDAAVEGFAVPGSYVDVIFRSDEDTEENLPQSTVALIEGVKILALNSHTLATKQINEDNRRGSEDSKVTIQVTPDEAIALQVVEGRGSLSLTLRHPGDGLSLDTSRPVTLDDVLNRPRLKSHKMQVFRGGSMTEVDFGKIKQAPVEPENIVQVNADKQAKVERRDNAVSTADVK